jgi:hypothetical protein
MIRTASISRLRAAAVGLVAALLALPAFAQDAAVTKRATELREAAADNARSLASLPAQSPVTRLPERRGAWVQVRTATGATGWVHLFDLGPAAGGASTDASAGSGGNVLRGVGGLFNRPAATTPTAASGIRGLGAEDLAQSQPDPAAVTRMDALRQSEADARDFAARAALRPAAVELLPAPARAAGSHVAPGSDPSNPQQ